VARRIETPGHVKSVMELNKAAWVHKIDAKVPVVAIPKFIATFLPQTSKEDFEKTAALLKEKGHLRDSADDGQVSRWESFRIMPSKSEEKVAAVYKRLELVLGQIKEAYATVTGKRPHTTFKTDSRHTFKDCRAWKTALTVDGCDYLDEDEDPQPTDGTKSVDLDVSETRVVYNVQVKKTSNYDTRYDVRPLTIHIAQALIYH
jgi:hypothetical protein